VSGSQAALLGENASDMPAFGWTVQRGPHSWEALKENVQNHIRSLNFGYRVQLRDKNVTYLNKLGKFLGPHELECTDKKGKTAVVTAARFVVAVGGRPQPLECPGAEHAITSDDLFSLERPPGKTCVVGAGYVALECAGFLTALGYSVTVLVRSILLRGFDRECCDKIGAYMREHGTNLITGVTPTTVEKLESGQLLVRFSDGNSDVFDTVLSARGRYADTPALAPEAAGLAVNPRSGKFDCQAEQTNVPHIYAIGDVIHGKPELTPVAIQAGQLLARR
jgi:thioredoxin reductase (NADPH)